LVACNGPLDFLPINAVGIYDESAARSIMLYHHTLQPLNALIQMNGKGQREKTDHQTVASNLTYLARKLFW
jgi:hypothetical protein